MCVRRLCTCFSDPEPTAISSSARRFSNSAIYGDRTRKCMVGSDNNIPQGVHRCPRTHLPAFCPIQIFWHFSHEMKTKRVWLITTLKHLLVHSCETFIHLFPLYLGRLVEFFLLRSAVQLIQHHSIWAFCRCNRLAVSCGAATAALGHLQLGEETPAGWNENESHKDYGFIVVINPCFCVLLLPNFAGSAVKRKVKVSLYPDLLSFRTLTFTHFLQFFVIRFLKHPSINSNAPQVLQQSPGIYVSLPFMTLSPCIYRFLFQGSVKFILSFPCVLSSPCPLYSLLS